MSADLTRFRAELHRPTRDTGQSIVPAGATGPIRAIYTEAALQAATVDAKRRVTDVAVQADDHLAVTLSAGVLRAKALMEADATRYDTRGVQEITEPVLDAFSQEKFAHNLAFYQAFGDHAMAQLRREIVPPPARRRRRWFSGE